MPLRQSLLSISLSWNHLLLKLLEFSVAKTAAVLWMAVSARALVILRGEGCRGPFVLLYSLGEDILFEVILLGPRSGVLSLCTEVELWLWDQVVGSATVAPGSWDRDVFFMVVMLVSEVQACTHLLWNQGLHLWDSGQWSWPHVCVCVLGRPVVAQAWDAGVQQCLWPRGGAGCSSRRLWECWVRLPTLVPRRVELEIVAAWLCWLEVSATTSWGRSHSYHSAAQWWQDKAMTYNPRGWIQGSPSALPHLCDDTSEPQLEPLGWGTQLQQHSPGTAMIYDPQWAVTEQ